MYIFERNHEVGGKVPCLRLGFNIKHMQNYRWECFSDVDKWHYIGLGSTTHDYYINLIENDDGYRERRFSRISRESSLKF